jgi:hypothetical protein
MKKSVEQLFKEATESIEVGRVHEGFSTTILAMEQIQRIENDEDQHVKKILDILKANGLFSHNMKQLYEEAGRIVQQIHENLELIEEGEHGNYRDQIVSDLRRLESIRRQLREETRKEIQQVKELKSTFFYNNFDSPWVGKWARAYHNILKKREGRLPQGVTIPLRSNDIITYIIGAAHVIGDLLELVDTELEEHLKRMEVHFDASIHNYEQLAQEAIEKNTIRNIAQQEATLMHEIMKDRAGLLQVVSNIAHQLTEKHKVLQQESKEAYHYLNFLKSFSQNNLKEFN